MTRPVTAALFCSVDGVVEDPHRFHFDSFDDPMAELEAAMTARTDDVLLGRRQYDEWSQHWPQETENPFASFINGVRKHVVSRGPLPDLEWSNSQPLAGELVAAVQAMRAGDGGEIAVCGSISIAQQLWHAGVLDTLTLMVHPVVAGSGRRMFEPGADLERLELVEAVSTPAGNSVVTYRRRQTSS